MLKLWIVIFFLFGVGHRMDVHCYALNSVNYDSQQLMNEMRLSDLVDLALKATKEKIPEDYFSREDVLYEAFLEKLRNRYDGNEADAEDDDVFMERLRAVSALFHSTPT